MIQLLNLLKNPLVKMGINKVSSHFQHKAEKTKIIRALMIFGIIVVKSAFNEAMASLKSFTKLGLSLSG